MSKHIYPSGPMRGYPQYNFPMFDRVSDILKGYGWIVHSPADLDRKLDGFDPITNPEAEPPKGLTFKKCMERDLPEVARCDAIVMLPGWERSLGANMELEHARSLGLTVFEWIDEDGVLSEEGLQPNQETLRMAHEMLEAEEKEEQERMAKEGETKHYSEGKPLVQDIPYSLLEGIGHVLRWAAYDKNPAYPRMNWRKGIAWTEFIGSALRHIEKWKDGEDLDPESGLSHLWHAATNLMFNIEYLKRGIGTDDRWKGTGDE